MATKFNDFAYQDLLRQVLESDHRRKKRMSGRHIPISTWLDALSIPQYIHLFHQYQGVEDLIRSTEADIKDLGIRHGGHRAKIVSSLRILREKYDKGRYSRTGIYQGIPNYNAPDPPTTPLSQITDPIQRAAYKEKLQKDLERELSGDPSELRTRAWYHGSISREHAESVIKENGDFLVRDCISKPGDFVVTCKWKSTSLSFMITAIVGNCAPGQLPPLTYKFEEESFPSIQLLVQHYQNNEKPVTLASGAILRNPIARSMPLSYYDTKYGAIFNFISSACQTPTQSPKSSPFVTPDSSPAMKRKGVVWTGSQPVLNSTSATSENDRGGGGGEGGRRSRDSRSSSLDRCDSLPVINLIPPGGKENMEVTTKSVDVFHTKSPVIFHQRSGSAPVFTPSEPVKINNNNYNNNNNNSSSKEYENVMNNNNNKVPHRPFHRKNGNSKLSSSSSLSSSSLSSSPSTGRQLSSSSSETSLTNPAPPKPSRVPSLKYKQKPHVVIRKVLVEDDDRDYSDFNQVTEGPSWLLREKSNLKTKPIAERASLNVSLSEAPSPQKGRRANRLNKTGLSLNTNTVTSPNTAPNMDRSPTGNGKTSPRVPPQFATGLVPEEEPQQPSSPTYRIVARSRSFQAKNNEDGDDDDNGYDNDYDNNFNNVKGYSTLPSRSDKKKKARERKDSDTDFSVIDKGNTDYDYPVDDKERLELPDAYTLNARRITHPPEFYKSAINPDNFRSNLLPVDHKVLDATVLRNAKAILLNKSPKAIALHITKHDLHLLKAVTPKDLGMGITSGFELLTVPQGKELRRDVIERWEGLRLYVILTLMSSQTVTERAKVLSLWIQTGFELKTKIGNALSFTSIMAGMTAPQIIRLKDTWLILRQNHTASAYLFDTKLKAAYTSLKDGSSDLPLDNVSVPYILPVAQLLESDVDVIVNGLSWEEGLDPVGVAIDVLLTHLDTARVIAAQYGLYRYCGNSLLSKLTLDNDLSDLLNPTFHLLLLWGDKGCGAKRKDRVAKMEQVFTLLSNKYQVPGDDGTEV